jgi:hypothetical protein
VDDDDDDAMFVPGIGNDMKFDRDGDCAKLSPLTKPTAGLYEY